MHSNAMQCNAIQAMQCNTNQRNDIAIQFNKMQKKGNPCNANQSSRMLLPLPLLQCNSMQHIVIQFNAMESNAIQYLKYHPRAYDAHELKGVRSIFREHLVCTLSYRRKLSLKDASTFRKFTLLLLLVLLLLLILLVPTVMCTCYWQY